MPRYSGRRGPAIRRTSDGSDGAGRATLVPWPGREPCSLAVAGGLLQGVTVMTEVACFCGCLYVFDGGAGACPGCGELAMVQTYAEPAGTGRGRRPVPAPREAQGDGPGEVQRPLDLTVMSARRPR